MKQNLKNLADKVNKAFPDKPIVLEADRTVRVFNTGSLGLNLALGVGGLPFGRIIEAYGPESSGKTTLALHAIAEVQKMGENAAYIDVEYSFDQSYAKNLGIDLDNLLVVQPDCGESALEIVDMLVMSGEVSLVVVDSVSALVPKSELEGEMSDANVGLQARLMSKAMRKLIAGASKRDCTIFFINQLRSKIGVMYGSPETTSGGNALKFYASVRLDIRRIGSIKITENNKESFKGINCKVSVKKNKVAPPFKECFFDIKFGTGIDVDSEVIYIGIDLGLLINKTVDKTKGIYLTYKTPLYPENQIFSSSEKEATTLINLPSFKELKEELLLRINAKIKDPDSEPAQDILEKIYKSIEEENANFEKYFELGSKASENSKLAEAKYYLQLALNIKDYHTKCKAKLKAVENRIQAKLDKNEFIDFIIITIDGKKLNVDTGEEQVEEKGS